jgi:nitrogen fixation protein FixH
MSSTDTVSRPLTGRTVLLSMIGFFAVILAVNGIYIAFALSTDAGIVANEPYRKGLKYNERITADERQTELGWTSDISFESGNGKLVAVLKDENGKALTGLIAKVLVGRATTNREDVAANLVEASPGRYEAVVSLHELGGFVANLEISEPGIPGGSVVYRARRRLWLKL